MLLTSEVPCFLCCILLCINDEKYDVYFSAQSQWLGACSTFQLTIQLQTAFVSPSPLRGNLCLTLIGQLMPSRGLGVAMVAVLRRPRTR